MPATKLFNFDDGKLDRQIEELCRAINQLKSFGTKASYSEFEDDGTIHLIGDATGWDDSGASIGVWALGATGLTADTLVGNIKQVRFDQGNITNIPAIQLSHRMKVGSVIKPHLHIINKAAVGATAYNVDFTFEYGWVNINAAMASTTVTETKTVSFQNAAALTHKMCIFSDITPSAVQGGISSLFMCTLTRVASGVQPLTGNNIFAAGFDLHFEIDTPAGSREAAAK